MNTQTNMEILIEKIGDEVSVHIVADRKKLWDLARELAESNFEDDSDDVITHLNTLGWHHEGDYGLNIPVINDHR